MMRKLAALSLAFLAASAGATTEEDARHLAQLTESYFKCAAVTGDRHNVVVFERAGLVTGRKLFSLLDAHPDVYFNPNIGLSYYFLDTSNPSVDFRVGMAYMAIVNTLPKRDYGKGTPQDIVASGQKAFRDMNCPLIMPKE